MDRAAQASAHLPALVTSSHPVESLHLEGNSTHTFSNKGRPKVSLHGGGCFDVLLNTPHTYTHTHAHASLPLLGEAIDPQPHSDGLSQPTFARTLRYHHVTVLLFCWHCYVVRSSLGLPFMAMNYTVHAVRSLRLPPPPPPLAPPTRSSSSSLSRSARVFVAHISVYNTQNRVNHTRNDCFWGHVRR